jgi:hypothetical protein
MRRSNVGRVRATLAVAAGLIAVCLLSGCGGAGKLPASANPSPTASSVSIKIVRDTKYRFRMAYPSGWVSTRWEHEGAVGPDGSLQYVVAYADPKGAHAGGTYLDSEQVAVYRLDTPMTPDELTLESASRLIYRVILKDIPTLSPRSNVKPIKVHGVPAWVVTYEYAVRGGQVTATSTLIVKGHNAYWLTEQAEMYSQRTVAPTLAACVSYFRLL